MTNDISRRWSIYWVMRDYWGTGFSWLVIWSQIMHNDVVCVCLRSYYPTTSSPTFHQPNISAMNTKLRMWQSHFWNQIDIDIDMCGRFHHVDPTCVMSVASGCRNSIDYTLCYRDSWTRIVCRRTGETLPSAAPPKTVRTLAGNSAKSYANVWSRCALRQLICIHVISVRVPPVELEPINYETNQAACSMHIAMRTRCNECWCGVHCWSKLCGTNVECRESSAPSQQTTEIVVVSRGTWMEIGNFVSNKFSARWEGQCRVFVVFFVSSFGQW